MKKGLLIIVLLLFSAILVQADDSTTTLQKPNTNAVKEKTDAIVEKEISLTTLPSALQSVIRVFTKFEAEISISELVIFLLITILFFFAIDNTFVMFSPFSESTRLMTALVFTLILGATGMLRLVSLALLAFSGTIKGLSEWSAGALSLTVILVVSIWMLLTKIAAHFRREEMKRKGREDGAELAAHEAQSIGFFSMLKDIVKITKR
jgi:hypothetical protein